MTAIYILGSIGGIIVLIEETIEFAKWVMAKRRKYAKYKAFYEKNHKDTDYKLPMGFKTYKELEEIEARVAKKG